MTEGLEPESGAEPEAFAPPSASSPPPDPGAAVGDGESKDPGGSSSLESQAAVGSMGDHNVVAGIYQEGNEYTVYIGEMVAQGDLGSGPTKLTVEHFSSLTWTDLEKTAGDIICNQIEMDRVVEALRRHPLLLLEGRPELGKRHLALKIAATCGRHQHFVRLLRLRQPVTRNIRIDLQRLLSRNSQFEKSVIVLENAFHTGNRDLLEIAKDTDVAARDTLERGLREAGSCLIFTYDDERRPDLHLALLERRQVVAGPDPAQMKAFLFHCAAASLVTQAPLGGENLRSRLDDFLESHGEPIVQAMATAPRIVSFTAEHLWKLLNGAGSNLLEALAQADHLDRWLLDDVGGDFNALTYVLALAVCHTSPDHLPITWYEFDLVRRRLAKYLRAELGGEQKEPRSIRDLCTEPDLMRRLHVEVVPSTDGGGDLVKFADDRRADRIWRSLLGNCRQLAGLLVPWLEEMATSPEYSLRQYAGWALGFLSRLDHQGIFGRLFSLWAFQSSDFRSRGRVAFGALIQGAGAGVDPALKLLCLERLRGLVRDDDIPMVCAGLYGLGNLGFYELSSAIAEMRPVLQRWLFPRLQELDAWETRRRQQEHKAHQELGFELRSLVGSVVDRRLENDLKDDLSELFRPKIEAKILLAAHCALVSLCYEVGATAVLRELKRWVPPGKSELAPLLAILFLRPQGILETLERFQILEEEEKAAQGERWSPILLSAKCDPQGVENLAGFLFEIYLGVFPLPYGFERALLARWMSFVETWTRQAADGKQCREVVIALWCRLLRSPDRELREKLLDLLDHPQLGIPGTRLGEVVEEIRLRRARERASRD